MDGEPHRMLRPEELTDIHSRELNIDLENEVFEEVNVKNSSDEEDNDKPAQKPQVVQREVNLQNEVNNEQPAQNQTPVNNEQPAQPTQNKQPEKKIPLWGYIAAGAIVLAAGLIIARLFKKK